MTETEAVARLLLGGMVGAVGIGLVAIGLAERRRDGGNGMQQELLDNGTDTSKAAAALMVATGTAANHRRRIYTLIMHAGETGMTRKEIERVTGIDGNSINPRVVELKGESRIFGDTALIKEHPKLRRERSSVLVVA